MAAHKIDPLSVDFRSLDVLARVYRLGSFTRAAEELEVTQSVVSYTIEKLRGVFGDPLFVREGRQLLPTPRCEEVVTEGGDLLARFTRLAAPQQFDPASSADTITIACNFYERALIIPRLVRSIRAAAPRIKVEIVDAGYLGHDKLLRTEADMLVGPFVQLGAAFYSRTLYEDPYVCLMDPSHPMAGKALELNDYLALEHIYITYGGRWKSRYMQYLEQRGHALSIAIKTPSPAGIHNLIAGTQLVATIPERLSQELGEGLHVTRCPIAAPVAIQMVWTARTQESEMHKWVRGQVVQSIKG